MDIARYIGLFLLKNKFAYIHGLGNLELVRKPASHDGQALNAPQYDVRLSPGGGSIDDTMANFIATHEQTSISKAANAIRDFATASRADLSAGKEVIIPALGKFVEDAKGIRFVTDPTLDYTPPPIPVLRSAKRLDDEPSFKIETPQEERSHNYQNTSSIAWGKIALLAVILAVLGIGGYFGWRYYTQHTVTRPAKNDTAKVIAPVVQQPAAVDTTHHIDTTGKKPTAAVPVEEGNTLYIIGSYTARAAAERRVKQLTGNGNKVELRAKDSSNYFVVMPMAAGGDTAKVKDSLRRTFNPKGVSIYR